MNNINQWLFRGLIASIVILLGLMILVVAESRYFAHQAEELLHIKQDYADCTQALRQSIERAQQLNQEQETLLSKKKTIEETDSFLIVNRDPDHLKQAALLFARKHKMEHAIAPLYQVKETHRATTRKDRLTRRARILRQRYKPQLQSRILGEATASLSEQSQLSWPLRHGSFRIGSPFGARRRPNGTWGFHHGLDLPAAHGTIVMAAAPGFIIEAHHAPAFGNTVLISHSNALKTRYAHLSKIDVQVGDQIEQGQCLGRVGNTGNTRGRNGNHLHFEVLVHGKRVNPTYFLP